MSQQAAQDALEMIQEAREEGNASEVSLTRPGTPGGYDPSTGTTSDGTAAATYNAFGVKVGYEQSDIDGTRIKQGDQQLYVPAKGFIRPATGEHIKVGTVTYNVASVEVVAPGDTDVLYIVQIRGV